MWMWCCAACRRVLRNSAGGIIPFPVLEKKSVLRRFRLAWPQLSSVFHALPRSMGLLCSFFADNLCVFIRFRTHKGTRTYLFCYPANLQSTFALLALVPVRSFEIVDPRNVNALRFHNKNELTLITCYPFSYIGPAPKRFIVHAEPVRAPEKCSQS